ncbi:MAG: dipeptide ABC transporter ATP-binding protein [Bdellovibrionota bacterium]
MSEILLDAQNIVKSFPIKGGFFSREIAKVKAVQGVSLQVRKGETLGLVGESGCGKSTLGRCLIRLHDVDEGKILYHGQDITHVTGEELRKLRRKLQIIFQDPFSSLNPRMTVFSIIEEPLLIHNILHKDQARRQRVFDLLEMVGLRTEHAGRYPHEFSGGQRQRIGIARALAVEPELIICDEAVSALDVSVQAQVINLLMKLQKQLGLTYIFIAHDLKVVEHVSNQVAVMYLGKIVESSSSDDLYNCPLHPYTKALFSAAPQPDPRALKNKERIILKGDVPSALNPPTGCQFHPRCYLADSTCKMNEPELKNRDKIHQISCLKV